MEEVRSWSKGNRRATGWLDADDVFGVCWRRNAYKVPILLCRDSLIFCHTRQNGITGHITGHLPVALLTGQNERKSSRICFTLVKLVFLARLGPTSALCPRINYPASKIIMNETDALKVRVSTECPTTPPKVGYGQRARSGPPGNKNAVKHGYYALVKMLKKGDLDRRTAIGRYQIEKEAELVTALGGDPSPQQQWLIIDTVRVTLYVASIDSYLVRLKTLCEELPEFSRSALEKNGSL